MRDAGEHVGALGDLALDTVTHDVESMRGLADFERALGGEVGHFAAFTKIIGGLSKAAHGPHLAAQVSRRHAEQQH